MKPERDGSRRRPARILFLLAPCLLASGCALRNPANRPITTRIGEQLIPGTTKGRLYAAPLLLPLGAVGLAADVFLIHPLTKLDDAGRDTMRGCWRTFGQPGHYVSDCASLPVRTLGMPIVYLIDWTVRLFDDVPPSPLEDNGEEIAVFPFNLHD